MVLFKVLEQVMKVSQLLATAGKVFAELISQHGILIQVF
jgi:hypothetical protein